MSIHNIILHAFIYANVYMHACAVQFLFLVFRNLKEFVHGQMASQMGASMVRLSRCIGVLMELQHNFDEGLRMANPLSDQHSKPKTMEDIKLVVKELLSQQVFQSQGTRCHAQLSNFTPLLHKVSWKKTVSWVTKTVQHIWLDQ